MKTLTFVTGCCLTLVLAAAVAKAEEISEHTLLMEHGDGHLMDMDGAMVMGQNKDRLPGGCGKIAEDKEITVRAGHKYTKNFPGTMFAFDQQEFRFKPCTRLTVHFINEDHVRHQWMMHGLPKFLYDKGMFHMEVTGPAKISGTFILPKEDRTYLVHCDIAQHMEKGMKAQLIVGKGTGTFASIPGVTDPAIPDNYAPSTAVPVADSAAEPVSVPAQATARSGTWLSGTLIIGLLIGIFGAPFAVRAWKSYFNGMTAKDTLRILAATLKRVADSSLVLFDWILRQIRRWSRGTEQRR
jgi:plastocyanin